MIRVDSLEDDLKINKYYYDNGFYWIFAETFETFKEKKLKKFHQYYIWDIESLKKFDNIDKIIRSNDMYNITSSEYIQKIRQKKLERIIY